MLRYLGMMWDDASPQQHEAAQLIAPRLRKLWPTWREEFSAPGVHVFCAGAHGGSQQIHRLGDSAGVVIGTLFARHQDIFSNAPDEQLQLGMDRSAAILQSRGRWLIENSWGNYVAFGRMAADGSAWVLKDPTGPLPCLRTSFRGVTIFFSRIADCLDLDLLRFSVNEQFLRAHVMTGSTLQNASALNEVTPLGRGECFEFKKDGHSGQGARRFYWTPSSFAGVDDLLEDPELAARAMRNSVQAATRSWANLHPSILLRLSGGLDSSIIAGCLREAPNQSRFVAYTYFSPNGRSDERPWARLAAQHSGCEHIEHPVTPADLDLRVGLAMEPSPEPSPLLSYLQRTTLEQSLAARSGATAIFNGEGGDSGFCSDSIRYAVPEYLRNHGLSPGALRLASQVALLTEKSSWGILAAALRRRLGGGDIDIPTERILEACQLVSPELRRGFQFNETFSHPWFPGVRRVPWDKIRRLGTLAATPDCYNVSAPADAVVPEVISPLYAQPVIELLLRIPIYTHFHAGQDRGLARMAFANEVPEPILRRLWKDRAPGFHDELLERHRSFLKETLLEGALVRGGLLDRAMLEEVLSTRPTKNTVAPGEVFRHLDTELWARHWLPGSRQQAAA
jgi:asparagine synthase (glutamine-hydrolysing)